MDDNAIPILYITLYAKILIILKLMRKTKIDCDSATATTEIEIMLIILFPQFLNCECELYIVR